jgi:hypothetical protein
MADGKEDSLSEITDLEISLHALTSLNSADSMMLQVIASGVQLRALVDTGSTHMFIHSALAQRLGLTVTPRASLNMMVANGDRVCSSGVCLANPDTIGDEAFSIDCFHAQFGLLRPGSQRSVATDAGAHHLGLRRPGDVFLVQRPLPPLDRSVQPGLGRLRHH